MILLYGWTENQVIFRMIYKSLLVDLNFRTESEAHFMKKNLRVKKVYLTI